MSASSSLDTLFIPLENGDVEWQAKTLFMNADWHQALRDLGDAPDCWQVFKPSADRLTAHGFPVQSEFPSIQTYGLVLCHIPKQVDEAKFWIAKAVSMLDKKGVFVAAAANDAGGSRLEKWFAEAGFTNIQSYSKHKARVVWGQKGDTNLAQWLENGAVRLHDFGVAQFNTQPGLFSWDRIDPASRLLIENFSPQMTGRGGDFGCGYGYLSYQALKNHPKITGMRLIEADARALACAESNLADVRGERIIIMHWHDATQILPDAEPLDFILMNPPFHIGKNTDINLGQGFIQSAAAQLKRGGVLSLVANNHLPYEAILEPLFKNVKLVIQTNGFKVIRAVK